ncbi:geranylgeranyl reductase family protein [Halapricum desulfuricans]|uniref:Dehydrogenase (Flavoprotein) n=1 Tax=Halapricum desulfuricans TaxID=2841257 RepID=A0A897MX56_9EURY|nr:geranylgeranyl reductase family protein [Halapricum desulfuricans]QSG05044.1 Dehydrogenase (flavoprotein) [Halapricum desulfuricans]
MHDFVVVGAGPAGSRFARRAAEIGHDVVVFEQGAIGEPLACSGHVSTDVWEFTPDGAREALLQNEIYGARFRLGGPDSEAYPFYKETVVSNVIDRVGLDRWLAEAARDAGADVRDHHTVTAVEEHRDRVEVTVRGPDGVETHEARLVAGADGPRSKVRSELGLPEPGELLHGVLGFEESPDDADFVDVHLTVPGFFAWRIPRAGAGVEYGLAASPGAEVGEWFEAFTDSYGAETTNRCSGLIPIGPPETVTSGRAFLVGDAAAQTKPFTGGGIRYGMIAADRAAETVDPRDPATLDDYESGWRSELGREIRLGAWIRRGYSLPQAIQRLGLGLFSGEIGVHMDEPSTLFSREQLRAMFSRS